MTKSSPLLACMGLLSFLLVSCGTGGDEQTTGGASDATGEPADLGAMIANADIDRGKMLYLQCRACHSLEEGGIQKVGPNLYGMFGSKAGFATGFTYSDEMANSAVIWSPETLDPWLLRPSEFIPGTRMVFVGIKKPQDRANLIAFLQTQTSN